MYGVVIGWVGFWGFDSCYEFVSGISSEYFWCILELCV